MAEQAQVAGEKHLFILDAVAVGVVFAEGNHGIHKFVDRSGHGQIQLIQPILADADGVGTRPTIDVENARGHALQHPERAVRARARAADGAIFAVRREEARGRAIAVLQDRVHAGEHAAIDQVVQRYVIDLKEHHIRKIRVGGEAGGNGGRVLIRFHIFDLQINAQRGHLFLQPFIGIGIFKVAHQGVALVIAQDRNGRQFILCQGAGHAQAQRQCEQQCEYNFDVFHMAPPKYFRPETPAACATNPGIIPSASPA